MKTRLYYSFVVGTAIALGNMRSPAQAQNKPAVSVVAQEDASSPVQQALTLLRPAAQRLSAAEAFSFRAQTVREATPGGETQASSLFTSEIAVRRPNKLMVRTIGPASTFELCYDGTLCRLVDATRGRYAELKAPDTLDEFLPLLHGAAQFAFLPADLLFGDVYGTFTRELSHAAWAGTSTISGMPCEHLAFVHSGISRQLWVGPEPNPLPRRMIVRVNSAVTPLWLVTTLNKWVLAPALPGRQFRLEKPGLAERTDFDTLISTLTA